MRRVGMLPQNRDCCRSQSLCAFMEPEGLRQSLSHAVRLWRYPQNTFQSIYLPIDRQRLWRYYLQLWQNTRRTFLNWPGRAPTTGTRSSRLRSLHSRSTFPTWASLGRDAERRAHRSQRHRPRLLLIPPGSAGRCPRPPGRRSATLRRLGGRSRRGRRASASPAASARLRGCRLRRNTTISGPIAVWWNSHQTAYSSAGIRGLSS